MLENAIIGSMVVALATILLDFTLGLLISVKQKTFDVGKLPQFLANNVLPFVGGLAVIAIMAVFVPALEYVYYAGVALVAVKFSKEALLEKMTLLFK